MSIFSDFFKKEAPVKALAGMGGGTGKGGAASIDASGGTTSEVGDKKYHVFSTGTNGGSFTFTINSGEGICDIMVVGGGGGGGHSNEGHGGGGGGGTKSSVGSAGAEGASIFGMARQRCSHFPHLTFRPLVPRTSSLILNRAPQFGQVRFIAASAQVINA